ncbi:MAG: BolA family protein [Myxococcota bacterium]
MRKFKPYRKSASGAKITIKDLTGGRDHYEVHVVASEFEGLAPLQRHRKVYELFGDVMGGALHALSLQLKSPAEDP